jgi:energy-coupling factor transporter transmembrane protein EcfT
MIYRLLILVLLTSFWTAALIIYILIIIAFNKTLRLSQVILTFQTGAVLLIPLFVIPLLFYNTITLLHWGIRTIRGKKCEQEVSLTYDRYQNVLIYAENDKNQLINGL